MPVREERASFLTLLAEASQLYRRNLLVFVVTGAVAFMPFVGLQIWSALRAVPAPAAREAMRITMQASREKRKLTTEEQAQLQRAMPTARPDKRQSLIAMAFLLLALPLLLAAQVLSHAALVPLVGDRALGGRMGPGRAWLAVGLHPGAILWTATLSTLATMVGFVFCVIPGLLAAFGFALAMPVVLLEGRRGTDALRRSWRLMAVEWPRVVGMWVVAIAGMAVLMSILFFGVPRDPAAILELTSGWRGIVLQISQIAISVLLFPLPVIGTTLVYLHARREQENIPLAELQLQMQRAATGT